MNDGDHDEPNREPAPTPGLGLDDVFYTLFRHKHIILAGVALGLIGGAAVYLMRHPIYESHAEISVPYISESMGVNPTGGGDQIKATDPTGLNILSLEVQILSALDLATNVAAKVGADRILAAVGGGQDSMAAAWQIVKGLTVATPTRAATLRVSFRHPDQTVVQPVLAALIEAYQIKSSEVHQGVSAQVDYLLRKREESRIKVDRTEDAIKQLKTNNHLLFPEDTKELYKKQIARVQDELFLAQGALADRHADQKALSDGKTNALETAVEPEQFDAYNELVGQLEELKKRQRRLVAEMQYTESHPEVIRTKDSIAELTQRKSALEEKFPALAQLGKALLRPATNAPPKGLNPEPEDLPILVARVERLRGALTNLQMEASRVMELEPELAALQRQHDDEQKDYLYFSSKLEKAQDDAGKGNMTDVRVVQSPTPPEVDKKKMLKIVGAVFAGCVALGLGIAFLIDLVFDRTIKRSTDIRRQLHLPVILTIPHTAWSRGWRPAWFPQSLSGRIQRYDAAANRNIPAGEIGITPWNPAHHLRRFTDGLRERVITYFEVHHVTHQPKLVAVTSCDSGVGVTSLAAGLAASLSLTGSGNVLLVDMNVGEGATHSFHKGKPGCGITETPETEADSAGGSANHFLATLPAEGNATAKLHHMLPNAFSDVMPKLKVSGYDYIVFDMPPVSQTSLTPRLSSYMDLALLVIESEQTSKHQAAESAALMLEARANVSTILNKCKAHVPAAISTGF
jgi:polysaccharide biosynthesis transport protein